MQRMDGLVAVSEVTLDSICVPSDNVVAREIEGEIIIVPLVTGIGNADDELYTLNSTGHELWGRLDGRKTLGDIVRELEEEFSAAPGGISADVLGFASEMARMGILSLKS
jgi:hypothetical protein